MAARIFYLGAPARVLQPPDVSLSKAVQETGGNTGNLLIGDAIKRHLRAQSFISRGTILGTEYVAENFDCIVIGASNFIYRDFDFGEWADFVEATKLPCTVFGLGAQAPEFGRAVEVPAGTRKLLELISERSTTLGVRGHWTASILGDLGITNVRVIGCPAIYWTCQPSLEIKPTAKHRPLAVAVNGTAGGVAHTSDAAAAKALEAQLARLSFRRDYPYFLQNETDMAAIAADLPEAFESYRIQLLMEQYGLSDIGPREFISFVKNNTRIYFDVEKWHAAMKPFDFVVGSRFHGCLMGLLAGMPCFVYAHDARMRELCELLRAPHATVKKAGLVDIDELYHQLDLKPMERAYRELYANYICFLEENGFEHNLSPAGRNQNGEELVHFPAAPRPASVTATPGLSSLPAPASLPLP